MQRRTLLAAATSAAFLTPVSSVLAADQGTAEEAKALAEKAAAYLAEAGPDKAFPAFNAKDNATWHDRDLYVFVRSLDGNTVAHGANVAMIGHTDLSLRDADGKLYNKEMIELATSKGEGWVEYRWVNPVTKKIEQKSSFIKRVDKYVVGVGFYKQQ
jgi:signal transduction histidine kinase